MDGRWPPSPCPLVLHLQAGNAHCQPVIWQQEGFGDLLPVDQRTVPRFKVSYYKSAVECADLAVGMASPAVGKTDVSVRSAPNDGWQSVDYDSHFSYTWAEVDDSTQHESRSSAILARVRQLCVLYRL